VAAQIGEARRMRCQGAAQEAEGRIRPVPVTEALQHLETGRYTFRVRGVNSTGDDRHTANKTVRIN
jgi:hypothetical protein